MIQFTFHKYIIVFCERLSFPGSNSKLETSCRMFIKGVCRGSAPGKEKGRNQDCTGGGVRLESHYLEAFPTLRAIRNQNTFQSHPKLGKKSRKVYPASTMLGCEATPKAEPVNPSL